MIDSAQNYISESFAAIPLKNDKSPKLPAGHPYLYELIPENEIERVFLGAQKIGIVCGSVSDGFEAMDFDCHGGQPIRIMFNKFMADEGVSTIVELHGLPIIKTPSGGYHIYYRTETIERGKVLARWQDNGIMVETRGNGQYVATIPSEGYAQILGTDLVKLAKISDEERDYLHSVAESFTEIKPTISENKTGAGKWPDKFNTTTAWGMFNEDGYSEVYELLTGSGWTFVRTRKHDGVELWRRPGKDSGHSATIGKQHNMFYSFTDSVPGFEKEKGYSFFDILMRIKFKGDKTETIKYLEKKYKIQHYKPKVQKNTVNFPLEIFPQTIQDYIKQQNQLSNFDINLMCSTVIWLYSVLIGNKATTYVWDTWNVSPVIWLMIIAERGSSKTHAINAILAPAKNIDSKNRKRYEEAMKLTTEVEREKGEVPRWEQLFLEDGTREGFVKALLHNPGGMGLMKDELTGWLRDMDRHSGQTGGDESFWLSSFNNTSYTKNIKSEEATHVQRLFISLAGSIQPDVINEMAKDHSENGLLDRFLFVPYTQKSFKFSLKKPNVSHYKPYCEFIERSYENIKILDHHFIISDNAEDAFESYYNDLLKDQENADNPKMSAYIAKLITYFPRICLIVELIDQSGNNESQFIRSISRNSVMKAKDVVNYFKNNAESLFTDMNTREDMMTVIRSEKAVKRADKIISLLNAVEAGELQCTQADIARFTGAQKRMVTYYAQKVTKVTQTK